MSIVTLNDRAVRSVTAFGSLNTGSMVFIKKLTASSSSTLSFVNGSSDVVLDSTYKEYVFTFKDIHPSANATRLKFNASDDTSSHSYDVVKTTTMFNAYHNEGGSASALAYETGTDEAQSTASIFLGNDTKNDDDACMTGFLQIFNPSSTTFVKHFMATTNDYNNGDQTNNSYIAGYGNTTSAVDAVQFKMDSGNIDAGTIKLYGLKDS